MNINQEQMMKENKKYAAWKAYSKFIDIIRRYHVANELIDIDLSYAISMHLLLFSCIELTCVNCFFCVAVDQSNISVSHLVHSHYFAHLQL